MKERPILFSGPMVRALLAGTKTQTRRVVKPGFIWRDQAFLRTENFSGIPTLGVQAWFKEAETGYELGVRCPYGQLGDRLWVRETWSDPTGEGHPILYRVDFPQYWAAEDSSTGSEVTLKAEDYQWKPSIHMFRDYSRITLEVTAVRVERLQDISEEDAEAEGIERLEDDPRFFHAYFPMGQKNGLRCERTAAASYKGLWESINGPNSWAANPWVWVVEFKRVTP